MSGMMSYDCYDRLGMANADPACPAGLDHRGHRVIAAGLD